MAPFSKTQVQLTKTRMSATNTATTNTVAIETKTKASKTRTIRSFVRREGRMTEGQRNAIKNLWERFGLDADINPQSFASWFDRPAPCILEIGFGNGDSLAEMAASHPENNYIGIDIHRPGIGRLFLQLEKLDLNNIKVFCDDAITILTKVIPNNSLDGVCLFFPDPWPKLRHHKRRIVQKPFVACIATKLKPHGYFHVATDWQNYAEHILNIMQDCTEFTNTAGGEIFSSRPAYRSTTRYENRGMRLGHSISELIFKRC